ncbi:SEFIR domain-containing protein [Amycolatopsis sp. cmx-8-4]|uniref:SEFIR domain-containing protein n=1 Tax=Amycolatopsis sp. cmx-8-4 TaxID=2790947 RepID=UPI0039781DE1
MTDDVTPRVVISYVKDDQRHADQVRELARLLQHQAGIDTVLDQWDEHVRRDRAEWFTEQLAAADYIIVVGSRRYRALSDRADTAEAAQIVMLKERLLGDAPQWLPKVLPVVLPGGRPDDLPDFVRPVSSGCHQISEITLAGVEGLRRVIAGKPKHLKPALGARQAIGLPRVVAEDRQSLQPTTFSTAVPRPALLDTALERRGYRADEPRRALVLTGEGGIGKSVLLGQLLDRLVADPEIPAVVLVAATSVPPGAPRHTPDQLDRLLGQAAHDDWGADGLLALLTRMRETHGSVHLLMDTLDLLLDQTTVVPLASILARALAIGDVVLTCRTVEFGKYLSNARTNAPRLTGRLVDEAVPPLNVRQMIKWADGHIARLDIPTADQVAFLESLEGGLRSSGSLRQVCALPVRLALTCETFQQNRHVPEDLTVTGLYNAYWDLRVGRNPDGLGDRKERAALDVAAQVVDGSGAIELRVPKGSLGGVDTDGLAMLKSEGVLYDRGNSWEFFHQTFAEYGHARWLNNQGIRSAPVREFTRRVRVGRGTLWPIATSLLLQADHDEDYRQLTALLPATTMDGARSRILGALHRESEEPLNRVLADLDGKADLLSVAIPALGEAPERHLSRAVAAVSTALKSDPDAVLDIAVKSLRSLLARARSAEPLETALDAVIAVRKNVDESAWDSYAESFLMSSSPTEQIRSTALARYRQLGPVGRRAVLRLHLSRAEDLGDGEVVNLAEAAFAGRCPPLPDAEAAALFAVLWRSPGVRTARKWSTWADVVADHLPKGWNNGQIKFAVELATADPAVANAVVDGLLQGHQRAQKTWVNVFHQVAERRPGPTVHRLLANPLPTRTLALNAITKCVPVFVATLEPEDRAKLVQWLRPARAHAPRSVWPRAVLLATDDVAVHRALLDEVENTELPDAVRENLIYAWYVNSPRAVLDALLPQLRALTENVTGDLVKTRAILEGRVADTDEAAREWVRTALFDRPSKTVAGAAAKSMADNMEPVTIPLARWLGSLLPTKHTDATARLAVFLSHDRTPPVLGKIADELLPVVLTRLATAATAGEDSDCSRALLKLATAIDKQHHLTRDDVREVYRIVCSRLPLNQPGGDRHNDHSAAFRDFTELTGSLMAKRLHRAETRSRTEAVLRSVDPGTMGKKIDSESLAELLRGFVVHDPTAVDWLEAMFGEPELSLSVKLAIAETFLVRDQQSAAGGRALRLKERQDCPPEVRALILSKLKD